MLCSPGTRRSTPPAAHEREPSGLSQIDRCQQALRTASPALSMKISLIGERQVKAYPRTQTDQRTVGKANGRRIMGAFRKTLFGTTFRFV